ncbi:MAG: ACT domain-containing protein [Candidatus Promineifilaceae bacterium]
MSHLALRWLEGEFTVHRFSAETPPPPAILSSQFVSITRTADELSVVAPSECAIDSPKSESEWILFVFDGVLDFSLTGILAGIAQPLAAANVSIFAISTFDTDYVMVKRDQKAVAEETLIAAGYHFK